MKTMPFDVVTAMNLPAYLVDEHIEIVDERSAMPRQANAHENTDGLTNSQPESDLASAIGLQSLRDPDAFRVLDSLLQDTNAINAIFELHESGAKGHIHMVVEGRLRLLATAKNAPPIEIGQCGPGQWIGLPNALREYDADNEETRWPSPTNIVIEAVPLGHVRTRSILVSDLIEVMRSSEPLLHCIRQHVAIRFARRTEILAHFKKNPILRLLAPSDQEYLLQCGTIRRRPLGQGSALYLAAGDPSARVALLLQGECSAYLPPNAGAFVGKFNASDLVGHEAIVSPDDLHHGSVVTDATIATIATIATPRSTDVFIGPGCEVLEFVWSVFRQTIARRTAVWQNIASKFYMARHGSAFPELVSIQSAARHLGTSTLTDAVATTLAQMRNARVCIIDLQGAERFETFYARRGFGFESCIYSGGHNVSDDVQYCRLTSQRQNATAFRWSPSVEVVWPVNPRSAKDAETLVELLLQRHDLDYILVCARHDLTESESAARKLAMRLNFRSNVVLYVTDTPTDGNATSHQSNVERGVHPMATRSGAQTNTTKRRKQEGQSKRCTLPTAPASGTGPGRRGRFAAL